MKKSLNYILNLINASATHQLSNVFKMFQKRITRSRRLDETIKYFYNMIVELLDDFFGLTNNYY